MAVNAEQKLEQKSQPKRKKLTILKQSHQKILKLYQIANLQSIKTKNCSQEQKKSEEKNPKETENSKF